MTTVHTIGAYQVPDGVLSAVHEASQRTGVDFAYMMAKAATESGFNPTVRAATSNATGLYQFIDSTWLHMVREHGREYGIGAYARHVQDGPGGRPTVSDPAMRQEILNLRNDPRLSALMAAEYALANRAHLESTVGGQVGPTEMYLGHFLGAHGASRFLNELQRNPQQTGAALFPAAAAANRPVFYDNGGRARSLSEMHALFDRQVSRTMAMVGGDGPQLALAPAPSGSVHGAFAAAAPAQPVSPRALPGGEGFFAARSAPPSFFSADSTERAPFFAASAEPGHQDRAAGAGSIASITPGERQLSLWAVLTASRTAAV